MMWLLLFALTALVVVLPMLPAIDEWRRPTDLQALYIDTRDALDPPFLARSFAARLAEAVALGHKQLGSSLIAAIVHPHDWRLSAAEQRAGSSPRVWHSRGDMELPNGVAFLAEVAAMGSLRTAPGGQYRALWAGGRLRLAARSSVTRWAHGASVDVAAGCRLPGRVSADDCITLTGLASFAMLHAPTVHFARGAAPEVGVAAAPSVLRLGLPEKVLWDVAVARGIANESLDVDAHSAWRGDLICHADLWLGTGCNVLGGLKAHGTIVLDSQCLVAGSVVAEGGIALGEDCIVAGSVISETAIVLSAGCVIGAPERPCTVSAPRIEVAPGATVHGTLWASEQGNAPGHAAWATIDAAPTPQPHAVAAAGETA